MVNSQHLRIFVLHFAAVSLLKDLKHANIVTLHDIVHTDKSLTLVFEYLVRPLEALPPHPARLRRYSVHRC